MERITTNQAQIEIIEQEPEVEPFKSGFPMIDEACEGFAPGEFIVLSGKPKHGKSLFMKTLIRNFYRDGKFSLVFSYEEMPRQFYKGFPNRSKDILFYVPTKLKAFDIEWIKDITIECKQELGIDCIFIDHGHFLFDMSMRNNASLHIGDIARQLKQLATNLGIVVFLIWHIQKADVRSEDDLHGDLLRDSGMLLGELDSLLFIYREVKASDGLVSAETYSSCVVERTRRSGAFMRTIPIYKKGYCFEELGGVPCQE